MINISDLGIVGDGTTDVTIDFNNVLNDYAGDIVYVPPGDYQINPEISLQPKSGTTLWMSPTAILRAIPVDLDRFAVIQVDQTDIVIRGGQVIGEREGHLGTTGTWGHGINISGAKRISVENVTASLCWGDGIYIGESAEYVSVSGCDCVSNRRQGMSITAAKHIRVLNSRFLLTHGTMPRCGIDIEPDPNTYGAEDIVLNGCDCIGNGGTGLYIIAHWAPVKNVRLFHCRFLDNAGYGIWLQDDVGINDLIMSDITLSGNVYGSIMAEKDGGIIIQHENQINFKRRY